MALLGSNMLCRICACVRWTLHSRTLSSAPCITLSSPAPPCTPPSVHVPSEGSGAVLPVCTVETSSPFLYVLAVPLAAADQVTARCTHWSFVKLRSRRLE